MRISLSLVLAQAIATAGLSTQTSTSLPAAGPTFDVVSIKRNTSGALSGAPPIVRPDGGFRLFNVPVATLISRAYPPSVPIELVGLPEWARTERYDFSATSTLPSPFQSMDSGVEASKPAASACTKYWPGATAATRETSGGLTVSTRRLGLERTELR